MSVKTQSQKSSAKALKKAVETLAKMSNEFMRNTGVMCMVFTNGRNIDLGNYYDFNGKRVLVTSINLAKKYGHLVDVPIYISRAGEDK